ncbi:translation initiation factor IF-2 [Albibacterium indicum]|uniref:translation initiation factor IF-2 n=1 Tax=Albibacterium indicum TaxID=2292082 RepID=UPI000E4A7EF0|nr:translation initiation factor IF-2 [Pedobacter indicus]
MTEGKSINLLKAAKELNIGIATAVEFLNKKGYDIESKPNTKLNSEMYDVLLKEYQGDKIVKEEANQIVIGKIRRDEAPADTNPSEPEKSADSEEILIKNSTFSPPVEPTKAPHKTGEEEDSSSTHKGVKVVGKIDLDSLKRGKSGKPKTIETSKDTKKEEEKSVTSTPDTPNEPKPVKTPVRDEQVDKTEEPKEEKKETTAPQPQKEEIPAEKEEKQEKEVNAPLADKETPKKEEKRDDKVSSDEKPITPAADNVYRTKTVRLAGPHVVGKIELPSNTRKKSQPIASSTGAGTDHKRKRKRKEVSNRGQQPGSGNPAHRSGGPNKGGQQNRGKSDFHKGKGRNHPPVKKEEPTEKEIQDQIKATLARLSGAGKSGKFAQRAKLRRQKRDDVALSAEEAAMERELQSKVLRVTEFVTANELATLLDVQVTQIISTCMSLGLFVSINQRLDAETISIVAEEFGFEVEFIKPEDEETFDLEEEDNPDNLVPRSPIVTVMGHVDHGKTSLLDYVRKSDVTTGEAGGITQHIGAYEVTLEDGRKITFLDTPGHEAFTAMRARGAKVTDIAIIVIAADDSVMPQTKEAINHAQAANVPIVFAFTKIDKPGANTDRIREQLSTMNILVEEWGGKYQAQEISSKTGENINLLLEKVLLEADLLELKADPSKRAVGSVVEAELDKGRGIVTTVLIEAGTLHIGDAILAGSHSGKVKALTNERGKKVTTVGPSSPVQILGMTGAPTAGDAFYVLESESEARRIANQRLQLQREQGLRTQKHITLDEIGRRLAIGNFKELNVIVKGDVDGSIEALSDSLIKLSTEEIQVNVIHKSVGQISESDVLLASASDAIIIGFQVRPSTGARKLAEQEQIDIRLYSIIYDAIDELKSAMEGMLAPKFEEKIVANVEIRETFKISKVGTIAGCMVLDGKINRNHDIRIIRDGVVVYTGKLASLKRFKDDVKEVSAGYECGLNIEKFNDIKVGDIVEAYEQVEVKRKL